MRRREKLTDVEYHRRYADQGLPAEQQLRAIVTAWLPTAREIVLAIDSCANRFWGQQQHLLYLDREQKGDRDRTLDEVTRLDAEMRQYTTELEEFLLKRASELEYCLHRT